MGIDLPKILAILPMGVIRRVSSKTALIFLDDATCSVFKYGQELIITKLLVWFGICYLMIREDPGLRS